MVSTFLDGLTDKHLSKDVYTKRCITLDQCIQEAVDLVENIDSYQDHEVGPETTSTSQPKLSDERTNVRTDVEILGNLIIQKMMESTRGSNQPSQSQTVWQDQFGMDRQLNANYRPTPHAQNHSWPIHSLEPYHLPKPMPRHPQAHRLKVNDMGYVQMRNADDYYMPQLPYIREVRANAQLPRGIRKSSQAPIVEMPTTSSSDERHRMNANTLRYIANNKIPQAEIQRGLRTMLSSTCLRIVLEIRLKRASRSHQMK